MREFLWSKAFLRSLRQTHADHARLGSPSPVATAGLDFLDAVEDLPPDIALSVPCQQN